MAEKIKHFSQLEVWKKSHQLALHIYKATKTFPSDKRFGLTSQMRRAAVSVPANIVEGFRRRNKKEKIQFYSISQASADELLYFLILYRDLGYMKNVAEETQLIESIVRMLASIIKIVSEGPA
jgi:four helix bundle protein